MVSKLDVFFLNLILVVVVINPTGNGNILLTSLLRFVQSQLSLAL